MSICLAISTFRQDDAVLRLIRDALPIDGLFAHILVVDSMGSGAIQEAIDTEGWQAHVTLINSDQNLGSAGNLHLRLQWAADQGYDFVFASNHDGEVKAETVRTMLALAESMPRVGAVFPARFVPGRKSYDVTGTQRLPLPFKGATTLAADPVPVRWASSNGALYSTGPILEGIAPWADLWMGWEDLGYGWQLEKAGWKQFIATGAKFVDDREYTAHVGGKLTVSDKPTWYDYYSPRNLILVARRTHQPLDVKLVVAARIGLMGVMAVAFKGKKLERLRYLARGVRDGLRGVSGKSDIP